MMKRQFKPVSNHHIPKQKNAFSLGFLVDEI